MNVGNKNGFTITELLAGIVVGAIVLLTIFTVGTLAYESYTNLRKKSDVYNDSQFVLQMIKEGVRQSTVAPSITGAPGSYCLTIGSNNYYISGTTNMVYGASCNNLVNKVMISGVTSLVFTPSISGQLVRMNLSGTKSNVNFSYALSAARRNP